MKPAEIGDNSGAVHPQQLRAFVERIERLNSEKQEIAADIKDVYAEAKGGGFAPKIIRQVIKLRAMDQGKRREEEEMLDLYCASLGI